MLELNNVTVSFNDKIVLENIDLTINDGDIVSIIGPSGSGKSTLIRVMNQLVTPISGRVYFDKELITSKNINKVREHMGMVFQAFELFPHLNVLNNLILAPVQLKIMTKEEATSKAEELLKRVNLLEKINSYPDSLSGGQKQRIAIVRSLMMDPKMMLFDEPTSALDPEMVKEVLEVIKDLAKSGMTICIVTHEMNFARQVSNRVLFIDDKKVLEDGTPDEVFNHPKTERLKDFFSKIL